MDNSVLLDTFSNELSCRRRDFKLNRLFRLLLHADCVCRNAVAMTIDPDTQSDQITSTQFVVYAEVKESELLYRKSG